MSTYTFLLCFALLNISLVVYHSNIFAIHLHLRYLLYICIDFLRVYIKIVCTSLYVYIIYIGSGLGSGLYSEFGSGSGLNSKFLCVKVYTVLVKLF